MSVQEKVNKLTPTQKIGGVIALVAGIPGILTGMGAGVKAITDMYFVSTEEMTKFENSINRSFLLLESRGIQEKIFTIDDKEIDGKITITDKKKRIRLAADLRDLQKEYQSLK